MSVKLEKISFNRHLLIALGIRAGLIAFGQIQDVYSEVPYTDIDYKVVTDGSRYITQQDTPFKRHTYRYSPILAYLLLPNLFIHNDFGKVLFSIFDVLVGVLIQKIVYNELRCSFVRLAESILSGNKKEKAEKIQKLILPVKYKDWANCAALFWLYNPLSMVIATRGNGDSVSSFFVLSTIYFVQTFNSKSIHIFLAGLCYGMAIHLRIYPVILGLAFFLSLTEKTLPKQTNWMLFRNLYFSVVNIKRPNRKQLLFVVGTCTSAISLTGLFYYMYGWEYIYEAYLYHLIRKDTKHNFSLYFLSQYLTTDVQQTLVANLLLSLPRAITLLYLTLTFGLNLKTLSFCIFSMVFTMVTFNPVVTSQYFIWYLALLPLCFKNLRKISIKLAVTYFCLWMLAQGMWLLPAYYLEFKCSNTFEYIGMQSAWFFFINIFVLQRLIYNFDVIGTAK